MNSLKGCCHCGAVEFELSSDKLNGMRRCDCSLCRKKGAIMATAPLAELRGTKSEGRLSLYQWNTKTAKHYLCSICGIYTHHQRCSNPEEFGFNVACIEGINVAELESVERTDGKKSLLVEED